MNSWHVIIYTYQLMMCVRFWIHIIMSSLVHFMYESIYIMNSCGHFIDVYVLITIIPPACCNLCIFSSFFCRSLFKFQVSGFSSNLNLKNHNWICSSSMKQTQGCTVLPLLLAEHRSYSRIAHCISFIAKSGNLLLKQQARTNIMIIITSDCYSIRLLLLQIVIESHCYCFSSEPLSLCVSVLPLAWLPQPCWLRFHASRQAASCPVSLLLTSDIAKNFLILFQTFHGTGHGGISPSETWCMHRVAMATEEVLCPCRVSTWLDRGTGYYLLYTFFLHCKNTYSISIPSRVICSSSTAYCQEI